MVDERQDEPFIAALAWDEEQGGNVEHIAEH
jgi:hypothetical protein